MGNYGMEVNGQWVPFDMRLADYPPDIHPIDYSVPFDPAMLKPCVEIPCGLALESDDE